VGSGWRVAVNVVSLLEEVLTANCWWMLVRLLHDVDLDRLNYNKVDGKRLFGTPYQAPEV